jgi:1,2-phenylacetyl-CoA epoxidase catalytic subunit
MVQDVETFIADLDQENESFFAALPSSSKQYWSGKLTGTAAAEALKPRWFNELRGVEVIGRFIERVPDITLKVLVGRQVGDEAKHAMYCRRRIAQLGGRVEDYCPTDEQLAFGDLLDDLIFPEEFFAAQQFTVETQSIKRNEAALDCFDPVTARMFEKHINPDERFHVRLGHMGLLAFARTEIAQDRARTAARRVREVHASMVRHHRFDMDKKGMQEL